MFPQSGTAMKYFVSVVFVDLIFVLIDLFLIFIRAVYSLSKYFSHSNFYPVPLDTVPASFEMMSLKSAAAILQRIMPSQQKLLNSQTDSQRVEFS